MAEERGSGMGGLLVGAAGGSLLTAAIATLFAARPGQAAPDNAKIDYLIKLAEAQIVTNAMLTEALQSMDATLKDIREVNGIDFAFDPLRYIVWKLRSGEAYAERASVYQLVAPAATFTIALVMPEGYVRIGIRDAITVSQNGVFQMTRWVDGLALPWMLIPRVASQEFNWSETLPFGFVVRDGTVVAFTNLDAFNQWVIVASFAIYLRKDVWEADSKVMDLVAAKYSTPPEVIV